MIVATNSLEFSLKGDMETMHAYKHNHASTIGTVDQPCARTPCSGTWTNANSIVVIHRPLLVRECFVRALELLAGCTVLSFASAEDWLEASNSTSAPVILFCAGKTEMQREMTLLMESANHPSIIVVADEDASDQVVAALDEGARGYVLTSDTLSEVIAAIRLVRAGGIFVPASSLMVARRPAAGTGAAKPTRASALTPRQGAVLKALSHGKPNKILAHELGMAESTVKVHVRNIMRKFGATNRTHLAFLANQATGVDTEGGGHREAAGFS